MSTRIDKGGPKFKPILKSRARPSVTPAPQDARSFPSVEPGTSMAPPLAIPGRTPSVAPVPRAPSATPAPSSSSNIIVPSRSDVVPGSSTATPIAGTSRGVPVVVSQSTSTPLSTPAPSIPAPTAASKGKKRATLDTMDNETTGDERPGLTPSTDKRSEVGRKRPKLSIVQAEADRVTRPRRAKEKKKAVVSEEEGGTAAEGTIGAAAEPPKKRTRASKKKAADENTVDSTGSAPKPKRTRATRKPSCEAAAGSEDAADTDESQSESEAPIKKKRRRRAATMAAEEPEGTPEPIDPTQVTMGAICDDTGSGRMSSRWETSQVHYAEARKRAKDERTRAIAEAAEEERETGRLVAKKNAPKPVLPAEDGAAGEESVVENTGDDPDEFTYAESLKASHYAPQVRIGANGEVVLDMESLQVDRAADPEIAEEAYSFVEESDQTKFTNSNSWSKRRSVRWGKDDTALFYDALRQFGQNFDLIARVLPGRTYRMCKNKFKAEDKKNPGLIDDALKNSAAIDLNTLSRMTGKDFSGPTPVIKAKKALDLREDDAPAVQVASNDAEGSGAREESQNLEMDNGEKVVEENDNSGDKMSEADPDTRQSASPPPQSLLNTIDTARQSTSPPPAESILPTISTSGPSQFGPTRISAPDRVSSAVNISAPTRQPPAKAVPSAPAPSATIPGPPAKKKGRKKKASEEGVEILGLVDDHIED